MLDLFRDTQYKERIVKVEELFRQLRFIEQDGREIPGLFKQSNEQFPKTLENLEDGRTE
jgi:septation ring formation regulator EzrA